jgi:hypothetical protein
MRLTGFVRTLTKFRAQQNATESPLLRLPPEVRNKIWTYAVKVDRVLVPTEYCWKSETHRFTKGGAVAVKYDGAIASRHQRTADRCCPFRRLGAFHLPEVCRQIYIDTSTLSYSSNIFLVGRESLVHNNWARKKIMLAQRDAITRLECSEDLLDEQLFYGHQLRVSLKERGFRNLTHVHVSFHTQKLLVQDRRQHGYMRKYRLKGPKELLAWCKAKLKEIEGSDLVVVFEKANTPKVDDHTTSAGD